MKNLQNFRNKVKEWNNLKHRVRELHNELKRGIEKHQMTIVGILDELGNLITKIDVKVGNKLYFKIRHNLKLNKYHLHSKGGNTRIYWKSLKDVKGHENIGSGSDSLWNFNSGGSNHYEVITDILNFLIEKYPDEYERYLMKKQTDKYNI